MHELLTPREMAQADRLAGNTPALIAAAGRAVARAIRRHYAPRGTIALIGPGNNGADGTAAARYLAQEGWPVRCRRPEETSAAEIARADLVIDALFGAGLSRDIGPEHAALLRAARRIVAVDVPSGLDGATGTPRGYAPQAERTITFFRLKPGHLLYPGRGLCGEIELADIGFPVAVLERIAPRTFLNGPWGWRLPVARADGHKYSNGDVTVLSGDLPGAARLACMAARRCGAGMVTLSVEKAYIPPEAGLIVRDSPLEELLRDARRTVWVCGPGLGIGSAGAKLERLIRAGRTIVADADALTACAETPERLRGAAILTPHAGEFARVFGPPGGDKLAAVRAAAARTGAVTVLKGADTIIAAPDGRAAINRNAPPWLATGGTGDVLSGTIAALLARGMPAFEAGCAAVWLNGEAANRLGQGLIAEDLPPALAQAIAGLVQA